MGHDALLDFINEAGKLKLIHRAGWVDSGVSEPESVADHSFRVALMAIVLADSEELDTLKVVKMALLHDLAEAELGDLTPTQKRAIEKDFKNMENNAMNRLINKLPPNIQSSYWHTWLELKENITPEARLVRDCDKLEMMIQASEYQATGGDRDKLMRFWQAEIVGDKAKAIRDSVKARFRIP